MPFDKNIRVNNNEQQINNDPNKFTMQKSLPCNEQKIEDDSRKGCWGV